MSPGPVWRLEQIADPDPMAVQDSHSQPLAQTITNICEHSILITGESWKVEIKTPSPSLLDRPVSLDALCTTVNLYRRMNVENFNTIGKLSAFSTPPPISQPVAESPFRRWRSYDLTHHFSIDPFADEGGIDLDDKDVGSQKDVIHIRIQQRNGRKSLTTVQGIPKGEHLFNSSGRPRLITDDLRPSEYDAQKLVKKLRKVHMPSRRPRI